PVGRTGRASRRVLELENPTLTALELAMHRELRRPGGDLDRGDHREAHRAGRGSLRRRLRRRESADIEAEHLDARSGPRRLWPELAFDREPTVGDVDRAGRHARGIARRYRDLLQPARLRDDLARIL